MPNVNYQKTQFVRIVYIRVKITLYDFMMLN